MKKNGDAERPRKLGGIGVFVRERIPLHPLRAVIRGVCLSIPLERTLIQMYYGWKAVLRKCMPHSTACIWLSQAERNCRGRMPEEHKILEEHTTSGAAYMNSWAVGRMVRQTSLEEHTLREERENHPSPPRECQSQIRIRWCRLRGYYRTNLTDFRSRARRMTKEADRKGLEHTDLVHTQEDPLRWLSIP